MSTQADRLARALLSCVVEPGHARLGRLTAELGPARMVEALREQGSDPDTREAHRNLAARLASTDPTVVLERAAARGIRFLVPGDPEWPPGVDDLAHGRDLYERGGAPLGLWVRGRGNLRALTERAVAVVGSRSATSYGAAVARELATGVAAAGWTVVSGGAFGIDQAAHRGALSAPGPTVAVLACGVDRAYPDAHRQLLDFIAEDGVVVSESAPGLAPTRIRFLSRNRVIAALASGTVVVEAAIRSGALNTATWADSIGRHLMGVPGPVTSAPSEGVHQLIRSRGAVLVTRAEEVLEVVGPVGALALAEPREAARARDRLPPLQQEVLDAVPVVAGAEVHSIARTAGVAPDRAGRALEALLVAGLVERADARWRVARPAEKDP